MGRERRPAGSRRRREASGERIERLITLGVVAVLGVVVVIVLAGLFFTRWLPPRAHVMTVEGREYSAADFVDYGAYFAVFERSIASPDEIAQATVDRLLDIETLRHRGPAVVGEVTEDDLQRELRARLGFEAGDLAEDETPTPTPGAGATASPAEEPTAEPAGETATPAAGDAPTATPAAASIQQAGATSTPAAEGTPGATATAEATATPGATGTATAEAAATATPTPAAEGTAEATATPGVEQPPAPTPPPLATFEPGAFAREYQTFLQQTGLGREQYERILEAQIVRERLQEHFEGELPETAAQVNLARIRVADAALAEVIRNEVAEGGDFAELAAEHSVGPNAEQGGELGWAAVELLPPEVAEAVEGLEPGQVSEPVRVGGAWDLYLVRERDEQRALDEGMKAGLVAQRIDEWLNTEQQALTVELDLSLDEEEWINEEAASRAQDLIARLQSGAG